MLRLLLLIFVIMGPVTYYLYSSSTARVMNELITASQNNDVTALSERFAWDDTRAFMKENITTKKRVLGNYGAAIGPRFSNIDKVVDYYILPENIALAYRYHDILFQDVPEKDFIIESGFMFPWGFQITLGYPKTVQTRQHLDPLLKDRLKARFVFRLEGLTWKVKEIRVPLFMVPSNTYPQPAIDYFDRRNNIYDDLSNK